MIRVATPLGPGFVGRLAAVMMLAGCALTTPALSAAQAIPDAAANAQRESDRIQREQESRRQQQLLEDRRNARPPAQIEVPDQAPTARGVGTGCRTITRIEIDGDTHLGGGERQRLIAGYANRCLSADDVAHLLGDVTKAYVDRGLSTTRAYLPEQDLATGTLRILVVEGKIGALQVDGSGVFLPGAFPGARGHLLRLRRLEQGIDQINRLSTNNATLDIRPGATPGYSDVIVVNHPRRRIYATLATDNLGTRSVGRYQAALGINEEDVLGFNELISFTRRQSSPLNEGPNRSSSETVFASIPYGSLTFSGGYTASRYRTRITTNGGATFDLSGSSDSGFATADVSVLRNRTDQFHLAATLTDKNNLSFIDGQRLDVSSRRLAILDVDVIATTTRLGGYLSVDLGYSRGLGALGALRDLSDPGPDAPRAQFDKWRIAASYFNGFNLAGHRVSVSSILSGQITPDVLYGSEQFSVGGVYSVRGFRETTLADDNGVSLRNEIGLPLSLTNVVKEPSVLKPYLGLDAGYVSGNAAFSPRGTLVGGAAGVSWSFGPAFVDIFVAKRFAAPISLQREGVLAFGRLALRL